VGSGAGVVTTAPVQIGVDVWTTVAPGADYTCGIKPDKTLWCWGRNDAEQLGDGTTTDRWVPVQVGNDSGWTAVSTDMLEIGSRSFGLKDDGTLWFWGLSKPMVLISQPIVWTALSPRNFYGDAYAIASDGTLWHGLQGNLLTQVGADGDWAAVSAHYSKCGLRKNGTLWCWGKGELVGDGNGWRAQPLLVALP
jgi:alpha-tubulin suppressor-like RCC1 family protein